MTILPQINTHRVGASITLQFDRPDVRQSCILLLAVSS